MLEERKKSVLNARNVENKECFLSNGVPVLAKLFPVAKTENLKLSGSRLFIMFL